MVSEPTVLSGNIGWIEVVCGGMFSGKTEELIRRARRAQFAGQRVIIVKPEIDKRYDDLKIVSHNATSLPGIVTATADQIVLMTGNAEVVCIDEAQFFDSRLVDVANTLANSGKRVIIAGLDMDFEGKPFDPMPDLLAIAEYVTKLHAICAESGMPANYSQRVVKSDKRILVGESEAYEPRARHCFRPPVDEPRRKKPIAFNQAATGNSTGEKSGKHENDHGSEKGDNAAENIKN
ncbi:thymidine kinase [Natronogracilivirga saccharolytica]|uniref:Thymidine kinase n=1 Tax=Natronogracilivirga saccharolytica TaxID=2812953 RepID=A0A8J7SCV8_9BACT|nr:thymidine kinase [Natronogracilivirga saccharolytica]MBP3193721.1 thymidine kinase [Natronogracilivirga saccharolytica]